MSSGFCNYIYTEQRSGCVGSQVGYSCDDFMGEWEEFVFNAFVNLEPVQRSEDMGEI